MGSKKPGPKRLLKNPRPVERWMTDANGCDVCIGTTDKVGPSELDFAEGVLRAYFRHHREELVPRPREALHAARWRITRLATNALSDTNAVRWSGYQHEKVVDLHPKRLSRPWGRGGSRRHVGPKPPPKAENKCLWLDTSKTPAVLKIYDRKAQSWRSICEVDQSIAKNKFEAEKFVADMTRHPNPWQLRTSWPRVMVGLRGHVTNMLGRNMGRAGKSGRPAYLACATLGVLLDNTPERIADFLANYRR
jgi:hypothetical protein